jgi:hypothetical protein
MLKVPLESPTPVLQVQLRNTAGHVVEAYTFRNLPVDCGSSACPWTRTPHPDCTLSKSPACQTTKPLNSKPSNSNKHNTITYHL